jgi:hypothetical protein
MWGIRRGVHLGQGLRPSQDLGARRDPVNHLRVVDLDRKHAKID